MKVVVPTNSRSDSATPPQCIHVSIDSKSSAIKTQAVPLSICSQGSIKDVEDANENHWHIVHHVELVPLQGGARETMITAYIMVVKPGSYTGKGRLFGVTDSFSIFKCIFDTNTQLVETVCSLCRFDSELESILRRASRVRKLGCEVEQIMAMCRKIPRMQKNAIVKEWQEECVRNGQLQYDSSAGYYVDSKVNGEDGQSSASPSDILRTIIRELKRRLQVDSKTLKAEAAFELEVFRQNAEQSTTNREAVKQAAKCDVRQFYEDCSQREDFEDGTHCELYEEVLKKRADSNFMSPIRCVNIYPIDILEEACREAQDDMNHQMAPIISACQQHGML